MIGSSSASGFLGRVGWTTGRVIVFSLFSIMFTTVMHLLSSPRSGKFTYCCAQISVR